MKQKQGVSDALTKKEGVSNALTKKEGVSNALTTKCKRKTCLSVTQ